MLRNGHLSWGQGLVMGLKGRNSSRKSPAATSPVGGQKQQVTWSDLVGVRVYTLSLLKLPRPHRALVQPGKGPRVPHPCAIVYDAASHPPSCCCVVLPLANTPPPHHCSPLSPPFCNIGHCFSPPGRTLVVYPPPAHRKDDSIRYDTPPTSPTPPARACF